MVVQGRHLEDTHALTRTHTGVLEVEALDERRGKFGDEDTAEDRQEELLTDEDSEDTDDTTECQTTRVAHEDLCGIGVVPEEACRRPDERSGEDNQLFCPWDKHRIQIARHVVM